MGDDEGNLQVVDVEMIEEISQYIPTTVRTHTYLQVAIIV